MSRLFQIVTLFLATACSPAFAQSADFRVSIHVLPERAATHSPAELPIPPRTQVLPPGKHARRLLFEGGPGEARRFYADTLPGLGFHRAGQTATGEVWERADVRAELLFHPVVGGVEATGILLTISPRGAQG